MSSISPFSALTRRLWTNMAFTALFLAAMGTAVYWLTSGETEKRMGRTRMLEQIKKEQRVKTSGASFGYDVTPLVDREYFRQMLADLSAARRSVDVLMFEIKLGKSADNAANRLVSALVSAKNRGVTVRVRLEQSAMDKALTKTNRQAAEYLNARSIHADFDLPDVETHAKAVLIDSRILYVGNHNWSESALTTNKEVSFRVESPKGISAMRRYFDRVDQSMQKMRLGESS